MATRVFPDTGEGPRIVLSANYKHLMSERGYFYMRPDDAKKFGFFEDGTMDPRPPPIPYQTHW